MGVVWRAHDLNLGRNVAVKLIHPWIADDEESRRRFDREARLLGSLTHENIVRVYDYGEARGSAYLVMELVDGENLAQACAGKLPLNWPKASAYLAPVSAALADAHAREIVHRDLSPANILIEEATGRVVVTDFGLARVARASRSLTATGVLIGTPEYWSPEQATGRDTDGSTDMYALGCILFQLLTGHLPFEGEDRLALGLRRALEDPPPLTEWLEKPSPEAMELSSALLRRDPKARPIADEVRRRFDLAAMPRQPRREKAATADVATTVAERTTEVPFDTAPTATSPRQRRRWLYRSIGALVLLGAIGIGLAAVFTHPWKSSAGTPVSKRGTGTTPKPSAVTVELSVPNLNGLSFKQSKRRAALEATKVGQSPPTIRISGQTYSDRYRRGVVLSQSPRPGTHLRAAGSIFVRLSLGGSRAPVPTIATGTTVYLATARLRHAGFAASVRHTPSWSVPADAVVSTQPPAGTTLNRPARVRLITSSGYPQARVPDVGGGSLSAAQSALTSSGFHYTVSYKPTAQYPDGQVLTESPGASTTTTKGATVHLVVSGYPHVSVPDVGGGSLSAAESALTSSGFHYTVSYKPTAQYPGGQVISQSPRGATTTTKGATVHLVVARAPSTWHVILTDSGNSAYQSPKLTVTGQWRVRYRVGGDVGGWVTFTAGYQVFQGDSGQAGIYYPSATGGTYQIGADPALGATWWIQVEALE
jgi:eukaryotic-like serine/threonine-protein kinase